MKKTKIFAAVLAAVMAVSALPQTAQLPSLSVTAEAASTSSKLAAPKNIKATAGKTKVTLKWSAVKGADGYYIYKYNSSTKKYEKYKKVTGTSCTVKNLEQGTKYKFKVAAYVKKNGKVVVQTKSKVVSATTKGTKAQANLDDFVISNGALVQYVGKGGDVVIPDGVTTIYFGAFFDVETTVTSLTLPNSLTDFNVLYCCIPSLPSINVYKDNSNYTSIDGVLFSKDKKTLISYPMGKTATSYTIPDGVTSINTCAFYYCQTLTSVKIPDSVTEIGEMAFSNCNSLKSVTIPDSVTSIGNRAFGDCTSLTSVTIPNSVTSIGSYTFGDCTSLTSITIPDSVTSIAGAFSGCTSLTSITIPDSVTSIDGTFRGCTSLTSITIPDSVTRIGSSAFGDCTSLESITIPDSVTEIGYGAFMSCKSFTSITIPDNVTSIGESVFSFCPLLTSINVSEGNKNYISIDGILFSKDKTVLVAYPMGKADTSYAIPNDVTSIGDSAFCGCTSLTSVTIPNGVTSIGKGAFSHCTSLTVEIPDGVTSIGDSAFSFCTSLTVTIPDSITEVGIWPFFESAPIKVTYRGEVYTEDNIYGFFERCI